MNKNLSELFEDITIENARHRRELDDLRSLFGEELKRMRKERCMSLREAGLSLGFSHVFIDDVEKGNRCFTRAAMYQLIEKWDL